MKLSTFDKSDKSGKYGISIWHNPHEAFAAELGRGTRFRLILVESGSGILCLGERREVFIAPAIFCLHEADCPELEYSQQLQAQGLYFHPRVVNCGLNFENIRENDNFSITEKQDQYCLEPFFQRDSKYGGYIHIGPASVEHIFFLFNAVVQVLDQQSDWNWHCRSRSFLLELLLLLRRICSTPQVINDEILSKFPGDAASIILYLHNHYQEKITLAKLAAIFHTNRTSLAKQFRQATGTTVTKYLVQLRIRLAALMLRDTSLSVAEIAQRVGFKDLSHFGRTFRQHTGHSPSEYRQHYCWHEPHFWLPRQQVEEPWRSMRRKTVASASYTD